MTRAEMDAAHRTACTLSREQKVARALCVADTDAKPCEFFDAIGQVHCNDQNCAVFKMARAAIKAMES